MPISFNCPNCGRGYSVSDALSGKSIVCRQCGDEMTVPAKLKPEEKPTEPKQYADKGYGTTPTYQEFENDGQPEIPSPPNEYQAPIPQNQQEQQNQTWHPQEQVQNPYPSQEQPPNAQQMPANPQDEPQQGQYQQPPYNQNQFRNNPQGFQQYAPFHQHAPEIPSFMGWAIIAMILFPLTGVIAIVYASQVDNKILLSDFRAAKASSDKAKTWCWISITIGLILIIAFFSWLSMLDYSGF